MISSLTLSTSIYSPSYLLYLLSPRDWVTHLTRNTKGKQCNLTKAKINMTGLSGLSNTACNTKSISVAQFVDFIEERLKDKQACVNRFYNALKREGWFSKAEKFRDLQRRISFSNTSGPFSNGILVHIFSHFYCNICRAQAVLLNRLCKLAAISARFIAAEISIMFRI